MRSYLLLLALAAALPGCTSSDQAAGKKPSRATSFQAVDVFVDSGAQPLAAYQIEAAYAPGRVQILSLEGGESEGFRDAPYYDPAGMTGGRMVIAAFVVRDEQATAGPQRVARLHLRLTGAEARLPDVRLVAAAGPGGERIKAATELKSSVGPEGKGK